MRLGVGAKGGKNEYNLQNQAVFYSDYFAEDFMMFVHNVGLHFLPTHMFYVLALGYCCFFSICIQAFGITGHYID